MDEKQRPSQAPDPGPSLAESLGLALKDPEIARDVHVTLSVGGGLPEQAYTLDFQASGGGGLRCSFDCALSRRKKSIEQKEIEHAAFADLIRKIRASGVLDIAPEGPPFLPDTVVGRLRISDGRTTVEHYFAADPDQASVQGRQPPRPLAKAVDAVYAKGAAVMGLRSIAPR